MLSIHIPGKNGLTVEPVTGAALPDKTVWIDLLKPDREEEALVEAFLGTNIPTHEERVEIETSSRLYEEDGALVMSATIPCGTQQGRPGATVVTFILAGERLASVRYEEPTSFTMARQRAERLPSEAQNGKGALLLLLDAIVDRIADVLEQAGAEADRLSHHVFEADRPGKPMRDYDLLIRSLGRLGALLSKIHESLVSLSRLLQFLTTHGRSAQLGGTERAQIKSLTRDIRSLNEFAATLDTKLTFLLDATLGLVNLQQNQTIKIISVLSVILMPPMLIASVYGMNFALMPEIRWTWGYPVTLGVMVTAALGTWLVFRWKRWL